ncbi:hypothetical protein DSO57_1034981 [Entomophthora muscae]|uniref:Uncharacterized protein n=1 Tax=Entomophthora muscae TaxID=34485 RepID=A0ACC2UJM7_9FUNG|nr:hypothetical protein DSO57_1034981 [Entomophthora muscae]
MKPWQVPKSQRKAKSIKADDPFENVVITSSPTHSGSANNEAIIKKLVQESKATGKLILSDRYLKEIPELVFSNFELGKRDVVPDMGASNADTENGWWGSEPLTKLFLADNLLTEIPERLATTFTHLVVLDLHGNSLQDLPEKLGSEESLCVLNLARNNFSTVPSCVLRLPLTDLNFAHNSIELFLPVGEPIPQAIRGLTQLDLSCNKLKELPFGLSELKCLRSLKLNNNQLTKFPENFKKMEFLEHLDISSNRISELAFLTSNQVAQFPKLKILDAHKNRLSELEACSEADFGQLQQLLLSENQLTSLGTILQKTPQLSVLTLGNNRMKALPEGLLELTVISQLDLSCNSLTRLPPQLGNLTSLNSIIISGNILRATPKMTTTQEFLEVLRSRIPSSEKPSTQDEASSPPSIADNPTDNELLSLTPQEISTRTVRLKNLKLDNAALEEKLAGGLPFAPASFEFQRNLLTQMPVQTLNAFSDTLRSIDFTINRIESFTLDQPLPSLTYLSLANNRLKQFPFDQISTLMPKLNTLDLSLNKIESMTSAEVPSLMTLIVTGNQIVELEPYLPFLTKLTTVDLSNNSIKTVPPRIAAVGSKITSLELMGNPFLFPRIQVLQKGSAYLLEYLRTRIPKID